MVMLQLYHITPISPLKVRKITSLVPFFGFSQFSLTEIRLYFSALCSYLRVAVLNVAYLCRKLSLSTCSICSLDCV